jgi:exonuclease VII small subunit
MVKDKTDNLDANLKKLSLIAKEFEEQEGINIEESLKKIKEAVALVKASRKRLKEIENEFEEIKKEVESEEEEE